MEKIDWTDLRTQKTFLLETINNNAVSPEHKEGLEGILALIDAVQDYAVDEMEIPEMLVFDFELEDERDGVVLTDKTKTLYICTHCNSDNVQVKAWVKPNENNECVDEVPDEMGWCDDCDLPSQIQTTELSADAKVIGFQVVGVNNSEQESEIHPDMDASFCLYNLTQARKMLKNNPIDEQWQLWAIWSDDVEEPTYMFSGDPRD